MNNWGHIRFEDALPRLVATYNKGKLAPFTGAGISIPSIHGWAKMITDLCENNQLTIKLPPNPTSRQLIQISEEIVTVLLRQNKFSGALRESLGYKAAAEPGITDQCGALAEIWWPLVMTTNYDRMFVSAYKSKHIDLDGPPISVFGRNPIDCHSLLSSLEAPVNTSYWALQGYFGESVNSSNLEEEIVVGYRQYRTATFSNPTFRAVFGEVFRNYSFLFIGSGLTEDYFMGLFGEVLEKFGSNPNTHCALFSEMDVDSIDRDFLHKRLNIVPIFYEDGPTKFAGLPVALRTLRDEIRGAGNKLWRLDYCNRKYAESAHADVVAGLTLSVGPLPPPAEMQCSVFSAGIDSTGLLLSRHGKHFIGQYYDDEEKGLQFSRTSAHRCWRLGDTPLYVAVARNESGGSSNDARDLREVSKAVVDVLSVLNGKYTTINIMLLAAGWGRNFRPVYSLIAMIRGYKAFIETVQMKSNFVIHIVDTSVVQYMRQHALKIEELINCSDMNVNIEVRDKKETERFQLYLDGRQQMCQISEYYSIHPQYWEVRISPLPYKDQQVTPDAPITIEDLGVVPGSTIIYTRKNG